MKRVCRIQKNEPQDIQPFQEPARILPILGSQLSDFQEEQVRMAGCTLLDVPHRRDLPADCVAWFSEDVVFSAEFLKRAIGMASPTPRRAAYANGDPGFHLFQPFSSSNPNDTHHAIEFAFGENLKANIEPAPDVWSPSLFDDIRVPPHGPTPHTIRFPVSPLMVAQMSHWIHVLHANIVMLYSMRHRHGLLGSRNRVGQNVKIHPTALVEGSILEDGAEVEAFATVLQSFVGKNAKIASHSLFQNCVIGDNCHTLVDTHMRRVVAFSGSTLSNLGIEDVVIGRNVFITTGVGFFQNPPGAPLVVDGVKIHRPVIGGAIGHDSILGARALMSPGTAIPSKTVVVMRPDEGLTQLTAHGLSRAHMIIGNPSEHH